MRELLPRTQLSAKRCAAEPGPPRNTATGTVPALRSDVKTRRTASGTRDLVVTENS